MTLKVTETGMISLVFVKAIKSLAFATSLLPLGGCAIAIGLIFAALLRAEAYAPDIATSLFNKAMLGFALVETFLVVVLAIVGLIYIY